MGSGSDPIRAATGRKRNWAPTIGSDHSMEMVKQTNQGWRASSSPRTIGTNS